MWQSVTEPNDRQDEIDEAAANWVARLGGAPASDAERRALDAWLAEDPRHGAAFAEANEAWRRMGDVAADLRSPVGGRPPMPPPIASPWQVAAPAHRPPIRWLRAAAMAATVLVILAGAGLWLGDPRIILAADHRTAPGERRVVVLADGSTVELGPASAIALRYGDAERRVELLSGQAYFIAAPRRGEERRPFVVEARAGTARALGTQFMVDRLPESVEVTVVEHDVAVAVAIPDGREPQVVLSPGQSVQYADAGLAPVRAVKLEQALAWRRGRLFFDRVPLDRVVAELNRYRRGRIVIGNAALATRTVSGVFDTNDPDAVLATVARELGARMASAPLITVLY
jgi:transmembrane sensor